MPLEIQCEIFYSLSKFVFDVALNIKGDLMNNHPELTRLKSPPYMSVGALQFDTSVLPDVKRVRELLRMELVRFEIRISKLDYFENGGSIFLKPEQEPCVKYNKDAIWKRFKNISRKKRITIFSVGKEHITICSGANAEIFNEIISKFGINFNHLSEEVTELLFIFKNKEGVYIATEVIKLNNTDEIIRNSLEQQSLF